MATPATGNLRRPPPHRPPREVPDHADARAPPRARAAKPRGFALASNDQARRRSPDGPAAAWPPNLLGRAFRWAVWLNWWSSKTPRGGSDAEPTTGHGWVRHARGGAGPR